MNWLARLKEKEKGPAIDPTKPTKGAFVGFVGIHPTSFSNSVGDIPQEASNDRDIPRSPEQDRTSTLSDARQAFFMDRGLAAQEAEAVSLMLERRDGDRDDRRLCLECSHIYGTTDARRCSRWRALGIHSPAIPADLAVILQRCSEFTSKLEVTV